MTQDMTQGKIMPMLVHFTIPLVLGNLFQLTYNAVDSIIVGTLLEKKLWPQSEFVIQSRHYSSYF